MRSCATRSVNLNGPEQTGAWEKSLPAASVAFGGRIIPARSVSCISNGADGAFKTTFTVVGSTISTWSIEAISLRRKLPAIVRCRSSVNFTAAASSFLRCETSRRDADE